MSSYKALYRKYRPRTFSEVVGQSHIVKTLKNEIALDHIFHAYLFTGPRGTGKTSIARIFAKSINCLNSVNGESCSECEICESITDGTNPDIIEIDAASQTRVDNIREIIEKVPYLPSMCKYKVYIIDEVHMLSTSSFNALLKTLEEPPAHAIFILCTTEVEKVIPTIISRCQRFDFHLIDKNEIEKRLNLVVEEENINIEKEAISLIAENAGGGMRDALSILDQVSAISLDSTISKDDVLEVTGKLSIDSMNNLSLAIKDNDATKAINIMEELMSLGKEAEKIAISLITYYKDILVLKNTNKKIDKVGYSTPEFEEVKSSISNNSLFRYIDILNDSIKNIKLSLEKKMYLELALIKMCSNDVVQVQPQEKPQVQPKADTYNPSVKYDSPFKEEPIKKEPIVEAPKVIEEPKKEVQREQTQPEIDLSKSSIEYDTSSLFSDVIEEKEEVEAQKEPVFKEEKPTSSTPTIESEPIVKEESESIETDYDIHFVEDVLNKADAQFRKDLTLALPDAKSKAKFSKYSKAVSTIINVELVASSRSKLIFSAPSIGMCNLVMKGENYKELKSFFKDFLDIDVDFIVLPKELWDKLSNDFVAKYRSGIPKGSITIVKIPCPGLKVVVEVNTKEQEDKLLDIENLFGEDLIIK